MSLASITAIAALASIVSLASITAIAALASIVSLASITAIAALASTASIASLASAVSSFLYSCAPPHARSRPERLRRVGYR